MIPYTPVQLIFFFYVYCFFGWIIESTWVSAHQKKFVNRGFMRGPFIPIYGFGAMALLLVGTPLLKWPVAVFFAGMLAASVLEYFTGVAMEAIFKVRYWDYSQKKFNINGHVCLFNSLCWGVLACVLDYFLHKPVNALSEKLGTTGLNIVVMIVSLYFAVDLTISFKAAFDLRNLIIKLESAKEELRIMQKRLDVMLAYANADREEQMAKIGDKIDDVQAELTDRFDDITDGIENRFDTIRRTLEEKPQELSENIREEYQELHEKFAIYKSGNFGLNTLREASKRSLVKGNPGMYSKKFKDSLDVVKNYVADRHGRD